MQLHYSHDFVIQDSSSSLSIDGNSLRVHSNASFLCWLYVPLLVDHMLVTTAVNIYLAKTLLYVKLISLSPFISPLALIKTLYSSEILIMIFLSLDVAAFVFCLYLLLRNSS